ncbi:cell division protein FtsK [Frankia sp. CNm7]|uniref:Cell division protein FtsK n=1 Tax=Frankia nepalensis TaxID=1836974 RepID=A0A937R773_9ACTN|nr:cell division protein FtsK [Frankia nepalensis]MBL7494860.1 cell division protein FtsK [Frankia nepalensis]MBL7512214.1 cell division protein FtsK [Frankia nepalensis]MBL7518209.1 cell division protein FtsK [Frankia nepalensis]MBL7626571.1 cell division protein FtsK [Frankia nepalensis]
MPDDNLPVPAERSGWVPDIPAVLAELAELEKATGRERSYEWPLDPLPDWTPVPVDPAPAPRVDPAAALPVDVDRRPVIPPSLRPDRFRATVAHTGGRWVHASAYHAVRVPWYAVVIARAAVIGIGRLTVRFARWWTHAESAPVRQAAADGRDAATWLRLDREVRATRRGRSLLVGAAVVGALVALAVLTPAYGALSGPERVVLWLPLVAALAYAGRPAGRPLIAAAIVAPRFRKLNADIVLRAYYAAKLGADKDDQRITFGSTMARDGDGSRVTVDLPYGKGFTDAVKAHGAIASGLDVAVSQVFLTRDPTSHRRHTLWVADRDPLAIPAGRTPLLVGKPTDIWTPAPFGLDERARPVTLDLLWNSILVGAQPRQGKTFALRSLGLFAALDPYVRITVADGGGKPDWRKFEAIADRAVFGLAPTRDGDPVEILIDTLREIRADVQARYVALSDLPPDVVPEGKLTREIARNPKYGMPVRFLLLDEFQEWFATGNPTADSEIATLLVYLIRVAPAAGVIIGSATQRPSGIGSGDVAKKFTDYRDNHLVRFSLRTGSWQVSDLVLGAGAFSEGLDSSTLTAEHKGAGILRGASEATPTVRTFLADAEDAAHLLAIARTLRVHAGTLSGQAAGDIAHRESRDVLADALSVFADGAPGLHWAELAVRLATAYPEHYRDVTADAISAQLRALGVPSVAVRRDGQVQKGARVAAIRDAHQRRTGSGGA